MHEQWICISRHLFKGAILPFSSSFYGSVLTQPIEREVQLRLVPDSFFSLFVKLNKLSQISRFLFPQGMLFKDSQQWWGSQERPHPHEGIDIYLMQRSDKTTSTILPQMQIPAMLPGYLIHFHRDFLGESLYIRHPEIRQKNAVLHTLYAHICPAGSTLGVQTSICPSFINKGQIVGTISPPPVTSSVPAHLHISCAWIDEDQQVEEFNWEMMSVSSKIIFIDPFPFLLQ